MHELDRASGRIAQMTEALISHGVDPETAAQVAEILSIGGTTL